MQQDPLEGTGEQAPGLVRIEIGHWRPLCGHRRFDGMGNRIEPGHRGHVAGSGRRQAGIEQRDPERCGRIAAGHFRVRRRIRDDGIALCFAPGARRCRDTDRRQQRPPRLAVAAIIANSAAVGEQEVDPLAGIERAAAAERHDAVDRVRRGERAPRFDHRAVRVFAEFVKGNHRDGRRLERAANGRDMSRADEPGIRDEQRALKPQLPCRRPHPIDTSGTEDYARPRVELERHHREVNFITRIRVSTPCSTDR